MKMVPQENGKYIAFLEDPSKTSTPLHKNHKTNITQAIDQLIKAKRTNVAVILDSVRDTPSSNLGRAYSYPDRYLQTFHLVFPDTVF